MHRRYGYSLYSCMQACRYTGMQAACIHASKHAGMQAMCVLHELVHQCLNACSDGFSY